MKSRPYRHTAIELPDLTDRLRRKSRKVTGPRQAILEILRDHPHPLTNKEIFGALPKGHCDLATIYRSMHLLESMGLVKRFDFGDGAARFELIRGDGEGHHHHLICTECSGVVELSECFVSELEQQIASRNGFKRITHKLEFFGVCPDCQ
jgi:Fur family transcriptional regulator, ferric uptake regulator